MASSKIPSARKKKIKTLLSMMNRQTQRFIVVAPPMVEMMDMVITDEELDYLLKMGTGLYSRQTAMKAVDMPVKKFNAFFDTLLHKGLLHIEFDADGGRQYRLNAIAVGWYEATMHYLVGDPREKAFSEKFSEIFNFFQKFNFPPVRNVQNLFLRPVMKPAQAVGILHPDIKGKSKNKKKTIPIHAGVPAPDSQVYPASFVNQLVEEYGNQNAITLFRCVCRHAAGLLDSPCSHKLPVESCIGFGEMGKAWAGYGYGRRVSKAEAIDVLQEVREKGAVHSVIHEKDDPRLPVVAICNCCWDCCGILKPYNMGAVSLKYKSYYLARIKDDADCKGCGQCERYCPTTAITVHDKKAVLNSAKCIGCGQCAYQCPKHNIELYPDERTVFLPMLKKSEARITA